MITWWVALLFFLVGAAGGAALAWYIRVDQWRADFEDSLRMKKARELHDSGRFSPARDDAGQPARLHRARVRKSNRRR